MYNLVLVLIIQTHCRCLFQFYVVLCRVPWNGVGQTLTSLSPRVSLQQACSPKHRSNLSGRLQSVTFINNTLINLSLLNLAENHFWTVPTNLPANLKTIDLFYNFLFLVLLGSLDRLPRLTHFHLHDNRFSTLPFSALDKLMLLSVIILSYLADPCLCRGLPLHHPASVWKAALRQKLEVRLYAHWGKCHWRVVFFCLFSSPHSTHSLREQGHSTPHPHVLPHP